MADVRIRQEPTYLVRLSAPEFKAVTLAVERVVFATEGAEPPSWRPHLAEVHRVLQAGSFPLDCQ